MSKEKNKKKSKVRFIKPDNNLKKKAGNGGLSEQTLERAQEVIEKTNVDFVPIAREFLGKIRENAKKAEHAQSIEDTAFQNVINNVMQLKASAAMFGFPLVSDVAAIALRFLDAQEKPHADIMTIVEAHEKTMGMIIANDLRGNGGKEGDTLIHELDQACKRYFSKHNLAQNY